jgi:carboxypeptidase PM20D1
VQDTITPTIIEAGSKDNVIPSEASAILDVRLLPDTARDDFLRRIKETIRELPVSIEVLNEPLPPSAEAREDDPLYRAMESAVRAHEPRALVGPWLSPAASDARFFALKGVTTYGFVPVFLSEQQLASIHGNDENVTIEELENGIAIYAEALERFLLR